MSQSAVILTQDVSELFNSGTELVNNFALPLRFLIYTKKEIAIEDLKIPKPSVDFGHIGHYSYFIIETSKEIQFRTLEWFTKSGCDEQQSILISSYSKSKRKWSKDFKVEEKFKNFHNCTLEVFSQIYRFSILNFLNAFDKLLRLRPFEVKIVEAIAGHGNFNPKFNWLGSEDFLHVYYLPRIFVLNDECHVGSVFWEDFVAFSTSPAESYSSYEKLFLPFDRITWCLLFAVFVCAFVTIFVVSRMSKQVQNLIFGENVESPTMNVIGLFYGLGQTTLPRANFARFILIVYMMFCVIINTAYHGGCLLNFLIKIF